MMTEVQPSSEFISMQYPSRKATSHLLKLMCRNHGSLPFWGNTLEATSNRDYGVTPIPNHLYSGNAQHFILMKIKFYKKTSTETTLLAFVYLISYYVGISCPMEFYSYLIFLCNYFGFWQKLHCLIHEVEGGFNHKDTKLPIMNLPSV